MMESENRRVEKIKFTFPVNIAFEVLNVTFCKYFPKNPKVLEKNADNIYVSKKKKHKKCIVVD